MPSSVKIDEATLARDLARGAYGGFVVVDDEVRWCGRWCRTLSAVFQTSPSPLQTKEVAGMLLYYLPYSTWIGQVYGRFTHRNNISY